MACAVYEHVQLNYQAHEQTWCPICKQEELQENCQLIHCTRCKLQLSKDDEVNLDSLRNRLADVHAEHLDQGCRLKPKFSIETSFGSTALYISCQGCSTFEEFIKSAFQDRVSDELKKIKDLPSNASMEISATADEANDVLWEYDGLHSVYQGECEEILLERQRIFYEDLRTGPARKEPESNVETLEDQEDEYLAHAVYEHMQLNDQTWCPICKQGELQENCQLIYCTRC